MKDTPDDRKLSPIFNPTIRVFKGNYLGSKQELLENNFKKEMEERNFLLVMLQVMRSNSLTRPSPERLLMKYLKQDLKFYN